VLLLVVPEEGTCEVFASVLKGKAESDAPVNIKPLFELKEGECYGLLVHNDVRPTE
jgi:hypothetical protein